MLTYTLRLQNSASDRVRYECAKSAWGFTAAKTSKRRASPRATIWTVALDNAVSLFWTVHRLVACISSVDILSIRELCPFRPVYSDGRSSRSILPNEFISTCPNCHTRLETRDRSRTVSYVPSCLSKVPERRLTTLLNTARECEVTSWQPWSCEN